MLEFETELVNFASGSLVVCWDSFFEKTKDPRDKLDCHGKIGTVVRKASPADLSSSGIPLGKMADNCVAERRCCSKSCCSTYSQLITISITDSSITRDIDCLNC